MGKNSEIDSLDAEEERILASFTQRFIEIAAVAGGRGSSASPTVMLNAMCLPAIALDRRGLIIDVNVAADAVFDNDLKIKDKRLFIRDLEASALLKASLNELANPVKLKPLTAAPIFVQRRSKLPVLIRIWPFQGPMQAPEQEVYALLTLYALNQGEDHQRRSSPENSVVHFRKQISPESSLAAPLSTSPAGSSNRVIALRKGVAEQSVALVTGGAVLGYDDQVHIDLDCAHTVLSPDEARQFATELNRIADVMDPLPGRKGGK